MAFFKLASAYALVALNPIIAGASPTKYASIVNCLSTSNVPQILPQTPAFADAALGHNLRLNYTPIAIAVPSTVPQVQAAVACGAANGVSVNPRSGGHSYVNHDVGGEDGHLMIEMKLFRNVSVDSATNIATVGPGARLGNMALALFANGERAVGHGICPSVGVGGHVLHGGQGYSSHTYGLLLDFLVEAEVVLGNSKVVTASLTHNSDLFWALRGAGMSYGIVTNMKFRTIPAPPTNVLFYYIYNWNITQATAGWEAWQSYTSSTTMPAEMNIRLVIGKGGDAVAYGNLQWILEGAYHGSTNAFFAAIKPLLDVIGQGTANYGTNGTFELGWLDSLAYANNNALLGWGANVGLATPLNYTDHGIFYAKSLMTPVLTPSASTAWLNSVYATGDLNPRGWYFIIAAQGGPTSYVSAVPLASTAYAHRSALFEWQFVDPGYNGIYPAAEGIAFLNNIVHPIDTAMGGTLGMYYNYADSVLSRDEAGARYWQSHYQKLKSLKSVWDPKGVFENPQTVEEA